MDAVVSPNAEISFVIPGHAIAWARAGGGKTMHKFTPKKQADYMGVLKFYAQRAMGRRPLLEGPIELSVQAIYLRPVSHTRARREAPGAEWKTSKPDGDNLTKIVKDALNRVVWLDDAQVASWHGWKQYGDNPRLVVRIRQLGGAPC